MNLIYLNSLSLMVERCVDCSFNICVTKITKLNRNDRFGSVLKSNNLRFIWTVLYTKLNQVVPRR